jgi:hypothetical protein
VSIPPAARDASAAREKEGSVNDVSQPLELIFNSKFLLFECDDPHLVPIGIGHLGFDDVFDLLVLVGQVSDMSV